MFRHGDPGRQLAEWCLHRDQGTWSQEISRPWDASHRDVKPRRRIELQTNGIYQAEVLSSKVVFGNDQWTRNRRKTFGVTRGNRLPAEIGKLLLTMIDITNHLIKKNLGTLGTPHLTETRGARNSRPQGLVWKNHGKIRITDGPVPDQELAAKIGIAARIIWAGDENLGWTRTKDDGNRCSPTMAGIKETKMIGTICQRMRVIPGAMKAILVWRRDGWTLIIRLHPIGPEKLIKGIRGQNPKIVGRTSLKLSRRNCHVKAAVIRTSRVGYLSMIWIRKYYHPTGKVATTLDHGNRQTTIFNRNPRDPLRPIYLRTDVK